ncbi:MAG: oxidoreductase-like domain-containing protein [Stenotrophobium sp.]
MTAEPDPADLDLPPKPEFPIASDCCGGGCADCVYTLYERQIYEWQQRVKELRAEHAEKLAQHGVAADGGGNQGP